MFRGSSDVPAFFFIFPGKLLERGWQPVDISMEKTGKEENLHNCFFSASLKMSIPTIPKNSNVLISVSHIFAVITSGHLKEPHRPDFRSSLQYLPI